LRRADAIQSHLEDGLNLIAALAIFFLMFVGVSQVIGRTVFDTAIRSTSRGSRPHRRHARSIAA